MKDFTCYGHSFSDIAPLSACNRMFQFPLGLVLSPLTCSSIVLELEDGYIKLGIKVDLSCCFYSGGEFLCMSL